MWHVWVFFLDVSIIVYPIALIQSWWKTRSRTGSALAGGWWLSLQEAYLGRLGGAHLETKRWLGWISRRQLVLVCISFFFCNSSPQFPKLRPRCHTKVAPSERTRAPCNLVNTGTALSCWKLKGAESRETCYICALNSMGMTRPPLQSCSVFWNDLNLWLICVTGTHWNPGNHKASWQQHWSTWYVFLSVLRPFHPAWRCSLWRRPKKILPCVCVGPVLDKGWLEDQYDQYGPVWIKLKQPDRLPRGTHPAAASFAIQRVGDYPFQDLWRSKLPTQTIFLWPLHSSLVVHWVEKFEGSESGKPD